MAIDVEQVRQIAERVTASQGLELVDVEFRGGGKARMLRLLQQISLACALVSLPLKQQAEVTKPQRGFVL